MAVKASLTSWRLWWLQLLSLVDGYSFSLPSKTSQHLGMHTLRIPTTHPDAPQRPKTKGLRSQASNPGPLVCNPTLRRTLSPCMKKFDMRCKRGYSPKGAKAKCPVIPSATTSTESHAPCPNSAEKNCGSSVRCWWLRVRGCG